MGSLSKHAGKGLCARVFDRLRLTSLLTSKTKYVIARHEAIPDYADPLRK
ncbi:hypothetical protein GCM10022210_10050 [Mucilaginibacter dorajii]|uniref:Uncharacterized protein n=1 Tax=Mucilaginibacter dorajii TaxID=692994 RepID=A0ABP7PDJ2_9SPHI